MEYLFWIMALVNVSVVTAGDADGKAFAHAMVLNEKLIQKHYLYLRQRNNEKYLHLTPEYSILIPSSFRPLIDEARKNCQPCLFMETEKRATGNLKNVDIRGFSTDTQSDVAQEFYNQNCPSNVYQDLSYASLAGLVEVTGSDLIKAQTSKTEQN